MEIKEQVLSKEQVQELRELGFDVEKYASMCWVEQSPFLPDEETVKYELEILTDSLIGNKGSLDVIPTLTTGDIIEVLPEKIEEDYFLSVISEYCAYSMVGGIQTIFFTCEKELINNLFNTLVWCIKQKHIEL